MFLSESILHSSQQDLESMYSEIDRCLAKLSTTLMNNKKYRAQTCVDTKDNFMLLSDYREVLQYKVFCDSCLKDYPLSQIIHQIRTITNKIR